MQETRVGTWRFPIGFDPRNVGLGFRRTLQLEEGIANPVWPLWMLAKGKGVSESNDKSAEK